MGKRSREKPQPTFDISSTNSIQLDKRAGRRSLQKPPSWLVINIHVVLGNSACCLWFARRPSGTSVNDMTMSSASCLFDIFMRSLPLLPQCLFHNTAKELRAGQQKAFMSVLVPECTALRFLTVHCAQPLIQWLYATPLKVRYADRAGSVLGLMSSLFFSVGDQLSSLKLWN